MPERSSPEPADWNDLIPLLDQELTKLPNKYRVAIVLCDLEGRSRKDVAMQLKIPEGTLSSRLTTARQMLAKGLARLGLTITGPVLASLLAQNALSACVPPTLVAATVKAASLIATGQAVASTLVSAPVLALKKGVLKVMLIHKLKSLTAIVVMLGAFGYGGTMISERAGAQSKVAGTLRVPSAAIEAVQTDDKPAKDGDSTRSVPATDKPLEKERTEYQRQLNNLLLNVEVAYWDLYEAYGALYSVEKGSSDLEKMVQYAKGKQVEVHLFALLEASQGERNQAVAHILEAEQNLRRILGMRLAEKGDMRLVPVSLPSVSAYQPNKGELLNKAMTHRPELVLARAKLQLGQDSGTFKEEVARISRILETREFEVNKSYRLLETRRKTRRADSFEEKIKQMEQGQMSLDLGILDLQRRLQLAQVQEYKAIAEYNRTLARLDFTCGIMKLNDLVAGEESLLKSYSGIVPVRAENFRGLAKILQLRRRADMSAPLDKALIGSDLLAFLEKGGIPGVTEIAKSYMIQMKLIESDSDGEDGKGKVLSTPNIILEDGQFGVISTGQSIPYPQAGDAPEKMQLTAGISAQIKVVGQRSGMLQLEASLQISHVDQADDKNAQVSGLMLRAVNLVKDGETKTLVIKNHKNEVTHQLEIKVSEVNEESKQKAPPQTRIAPGTEAGPPILRKIPYLSRLFKKDSVDEGNDM
jgi:Sigma-70, region 4